MDAYAFVCVSMCACVTTENIEHEECIIIVLIQVSVLTVFSRPGGTIFASCPYENNSEGADTIYNLMNQQKEGSEVTTWFSDQCL